MRGLGILVAAALATPVIAEEPQHVSGTKFASACQLFDLSRDGERLQFCLDTIGTSAAAISAVNGALAEFAAKPEPLTCIPEDAENSRLLEIGLQFILANPEIASRDYQDLFSMAWDKAFPCPPGQKP